MLHVIVTRYNSPHGPPPEAPPPHRAAGARHSHMAIARCSSACSFAPGTTYPARLPKNLDLKRIGFVLLQQPLSHASDSAPPPDGPGGLTSDDVAAPAVSLTTEERIRLHYQTLVGLRTRADGDPEAPPPPPQSPAPSQKEAKEAGDSSSEEEPSEVRLALSESSSSTGSELESEAEQRKPELREAEVGPPAGLEGAEPQDGEGDQRQQEERLFAQEYLTRVRPLIKHRCFYFLLLPPTSCFLPTSCCFRLLPVASHPSVDLSRCARPCRSVQMLQSSSCRCWRTSAPPPLSLCTLA